MTHRSPAVRTLDGISSALVRTRADPRELLHEVVLAAAGHLHSAWTMVAFRNGALSEPGIRFLAVGPSGRVVDIDSSLPASLRDELHSAGEPIADDAVIGDNRVCVPLELDGDVLGRLVGFGLDEPVAHEDLWVLRILANQAAMSVHTARLYGTAVDRRELLDAERHRIALELHDSVAQYVLSAGLAVDVCRAEAVENSAASAARLGQARDLIARAGEQVRSVIYALDHETTADEVVMLPDLLHGLAAQHRAGLDVSVRTEGRPISLDVRTEHALGRIAGEALFNVAIHAEATRAIVRLRYTPPATVNLSISDDGRGDPRQLRRLLRLSSACNADGRHQGLANMADRAADLDGTFAIRRSKLGGVRIEVRIPTTQETGDADEGRQRN